MVEGEPIWLDTPSCADGFFGYVERPPDGGGGSTSVQGRQQTTFADNGRITWEFEPDEALRANTEYYVSIDFEDHLWGDGGYSWDFTTRSTSSTSATAAAPHQDAP